MALFDGSDPLEQRRDVGKSLFFRLARKGGVHLFEFRALVLGGEPEIFGKGAETERIAAARGDIFMVARLLDEGIVKSFGVERLVFCDGADDVCQHGIVFRRGELGDQLIAHARLAFPRKRAGEVFERFRIPELHCILLLTSISFPTRPAAYTRAAHFFENRRIFLKIGAK